MNQELKNKIIEGLEAYMDAHSVKQSEIAKQASVNAAYLIQMRKGGNTVSVGNKDVVIADKYYKRIANLVGVATEKQYWPTRPTIQMKEILNALQDAKDAGEVAVLIGDTGCGKTFNLGLFKSQYPGEVFTVKVGSSDNLSDLVDKMLDAAGLPAEFRSKSARLRQLTIYMKQLSEDGYSPVFAFDEGEYMKQPALCSFKELFDYLDQYCSLVLMGTSQLTQNLDKLRLKNKAGIPQLYRRIKFRIRNLSPIDKRYTEFLNDVEPSLRKWLQANCDNYGELHDVMVPVMREADRSGRELDLEFTKMVLGV